jgi:hypothetical protein
MRLYARLGRREAALRQHQVCVDALKRELNAPPETETTQLLQEIQRPRPLHPDRAPGSRTAPNDRTPASIAGLHGAASSVVPDAAPRTNLPAPTSELIGRVAALAEVTELVWVHRLVTLIGAGGIGKKRLGLEVARALLPRVRDGAWVAELGPLSDPGRVPVTVAIALDDDVLVCGYEKSNRAPRAILDSGGAVMQIHLSPDLEECARAVRTPMTVDEFLARFPEVSPRTSVTSWCSASTSARWGSSCA